MVTLAADKIRVVFASAKRVPFTCPVVSMADVAVLVNADDMVIDNRIAISLIRSMVPYLWAVQELEQEILAGNNDGATGANRAGLRKERQGKPQSR